MWIFPLYLTPIWTLDPPQNSLPWVLRWFRNVTSCHVVICFYSEVLQMTLNCRRDGLWAHRATPVFFPDHDSEIQRSEMNHSRSPKNNVLGCVEIWCTVMPGLLDAIYTYLIYKRLQRVWIKKKGRFEGLWKNKGRMGNKIRFCTRPHRSPQGQESAVLKRRDSREFHSILLWLHSLGFMYLFSSK